jgi:uncharacterized protein YebE (UPF0316 family)
MSEFINEIFKDHTLFSVVVLPLLIFFARIIDVSINTVRIIFVMSGRKGISTLLGFFESLVWLLAIGQIFQHMNNIYCYIAYPAGFAAGIFVGMLIEEKLALGKIVLRIISPDDVSKIIEYLKANQFKYSVISAQGDQGNEKILFTVINRDRLDDIQAKIATDLPSAYYTVESVKKAGESGILEEKPSRRGIGSWLGSIKRK